MFIVHFYISVLTDNNLYFIERAGEEIQYYYFQVEDYTPPHTSNMLRINHKNISKARLTYEQYQFHHNVTMCWDSIKLEIFHYNISGLLEIKCVFLIRIQP